MGDRRSALRISVVNFRQDHVRIYLNDSFSGSVLRDVGLSRPAAQDQAGFIQRASLETISKLDGNVLFAVLGNADTSLLKRFRSHPLWSQLNTVKANRIFEVNDEIWVNGWHILGANLIVDNLFKYL